MWRTHLKKPETRRRPLPRESRERYELYESSIESSSLINVWDQIHKGFLVYYYYWRLVAQKDTQKVIVHVIIIT